MININKDLVIEGTDRTLNQTAYSRKPIAEATLQKTSKYLEIGGLNLVPTKKYVIEIAEYSTTDSSGGHYLLPSGNVVNQWSGILIPCRPDSTSLIATPYSYGMCLTNGWSQSTRLCYTTVEIEWFNRDWLSVRAVMTSGPSSSADVTPPFMVFQSAFWKKIGSQTMPNITSLAIMPRDDDYIGAGSYMKIYEV